jgi:hypothetical protein
MQNGQATHTSGRDHVNRWYEPQAPEHCGHERHRGGAELLVVTITSLAHLGMSLPMTASPFWAPPSPQLWPPLPFTTPGGNFSS